MIGCWAVPLARSKKLTRQAVGVGGVADGIERLAVRRQVVVVLGAARAGQWRIDALFKRHARARHSAGRRAEIAVLALLALGLASRRLRRR